jgi:outer membrane protein insertion porin family
LGYKTSLGAKLGAEVRSFNFGFTDPWLLETPTSAGLNIYYDDSEVFTSYSSEVAGADVTLGRFLTDYISASLVTRVERVKIFDVSPFASREVKQEEGTKDTISVSLGLKRDTRDDFYNPTKGSRHTLMLENAGGILGGDNTFYKIIGDTGWYFPLPLKTVLSLRGRAGIARGYDGKDVPLYEKFYVGGISTIRGFDYGDAGPRDRLGDPIGAENMVVFNSEFIFPLSRAIGMQGAIFYDGGAGWDEKFDKWNQAVGIGIRWFSPMGPIRIYWGYNLDPEPDEKQSVWDFAMGAQF